MRKVVKKSNLFLYTKLRKPQFYWQIIKIKPDADFLWIDIAKIWFWMVNKILGILSQVSNSEIFMIIHCCHFQKSVCPWEKNRLKKGKNFLYLMKGRFEDRKTIEIDYPWWMWLHSKLILFSIGKWWLLRFIDYKKNILNFQLFFHFYIQRKRKSSSIFFVKTLQFRLWFICLRTKGSLSADALDES